MINHIAIIVDGNGRWAQERNLKRSEGHKQGAKNLEKIILYVNKHNLANYLSLYVFSTENFKRSKEEVNYLMDLFIKWFNKAKDKYDKENIKVLFSKDDSLLKSDIIKKINELEEATKNNNGLTVNFCLSYGGRNELVHATKIIAEKVKSNEIKINEINEDTISNNLYQNLPDIDLLIRTSGEQRLSNFMLWQLSYSELLFINTYFPDFTPRDLNKALKEYYKRDRRFGQIKKG